MKIVIKITLLVFMSLLMTLSKNSLAQVQEFKEQDLAPFEKAKTSESGLINYQKTPSLMFTGQQISEIYKIVETMKLSPEAIKQELLEPNEISAIKPKENNEKSYIYLGSILYFSPKIWAVWINNEKISSQTNSNNQEIYVVAIGKDKVKLMWQISITKWKILTGYEEGEQLPQITADNKVQIIFTLKPNQTFILGSNKVVEGKITPSVVQPQQEETEVLQEIPQSEAPTN